MIFILILFNLCVQYSQASGFPLNGASRYDATGLQIFINNDWYYIKNSLSFGFIEANSICEFFLNSTLLSYSVVSSSAVKSVIGVTCSDATLKIENCEFSADLVNLTNEVINITCRDLSPEDGLIQLKDRSISVPATAGDLSLWGHFCYYNNNGWDLRAATLACNSLGYKGVTPNKKRLVRKGVLGLENIDCENAVSFDQCTFSVTTKPRGQCEFNKVITIQCTNDVPTSPSISQPTAITDTAVTAHTETNSRSVSYSSITYTTVPPTYFISADRNWMFIGAGVVMSVLLVNVGAIVLLVLWCLLCLKRKQPEAIVNLDHLYGRPREPGTLRNGAEQDPPQQYYVIP